MYKKCLATRAPSKDEQAQSSTYKANEHPRTSTCKEQYHPVTTAEKEEDMLSLTDGCIRICETLADKLEDLNIKAANSLIDGESVNRQHLQQLISHI